MTDRDPPHYLKRIISTNTPKRLLWLDCHAQTTRLQGVYVDRWAGGALGTTHYTRRKNTRKDTIEAYPTPAELWEAADQFCTRGRRVVLFAYDLAYQLRVSQCLLELTRIGWRLDKIVLERTAAWALLREGDRSLLCCDLQSWTPVGFDKIRSDLTDTLGKPNGATAGPDFHTTLAANRVHTIREAVVQILAWIEGEGLGPFRPTGSGQSYAAFRKRFLTHDILVHDDASRLMVERRGMHTGRCEAWRHGELAAGPYVEYDLRAAYATIGAQSAVPAVAVGAMTKPSLKRALSELERYALLADVTVTTEVPCIPVHTGERTVWPVGTFRTQLYDPELQLAAAYCQQVTVHRVWKYRKAPVLADFCQWVLDHLDGRTQVYGLIPQRVLKHWSRCMIGRLGLRYRSWEKFGSSPIPDLRLVTYIDLDEGVSTDMLCAGFDRLILTEMHEALESVPQIPGWIMSECRRRLWEAMTRIGLSKVVYVDTDSMVVHDGGYGIGPGMPEWMADNGWTVKGSYAAMTIHGPRNIVCDLDRRVSGLPLTARQTAPLEFDGQVMRSIKESMRAGELDMVASLPRTFRLTTGDLRRQHKPGGTTAPYRLEANNG